MMKRDMEGGFRDSPLRLNHRLGQLDRWDSKAIEQRAERPGGAGGHDLAPPGAKRVGARRVPQKFMTHAASTGHSRIRSSPHFRRTLDEL